MESKKVSGNEDDESVSIISESPTIKLKNRRRYEAPLFIQHESVLRNKENSEIRMSTTPSITPRISSAKSTDKRKLEQKPANSYKAKMKKTPSSSRLTATSKAKQTPGTTRQSTGVLINQPNYSVSIIEYRNKKQVGIAALSDRKAELHLYQFTDSPNYDSTLTILNHYDPQDILIPDNISGSELFRVIQKEFQLSSIEIVRRKYFNESKGAFEVEKKGTPSSLSNIQLGSALYLALAAANCVLQFFEFSQGINFAPKSLNIIQMSLDGFLNLDPETIRNLHIFPAARKSLMKSLFSTLNFCKTKMGERLLRSTLLQPLNDIEALQSRLDVVDEILGNEKLFFELGSLLNRIPDVDTINTKLAVIPKNITESTMQQDLENLIKLSQLISILPEFLKVLSSCKSNMLKSLLPVFEDKARENVLILLNQYISTESSISTKKSLQLKQTQLAFAIKPGLSGLLDVARATFCETVEEIHQEIQEYVETYRIPLKINFSSMRGYHFSLQASSENEIPELFIQRVKSGKKFSCSTETLISLEERRKDAFSSIIIQTGRVIEQLLIEVRNNISWMHRVSESIALLDLLLSFSHYVTLNEETVRPQFSSEGPIAVMNGRHPMLEKICVPAFIPNDVFLSNAYCLQILTGPNASGKSVYLSQIGVLTLMAHIGCYVPASYAHFPLLDRILTNLGNNDDIENNMGAFSKQCKEAAFIARNCSRKTLVLMDEYGKATSSMEGLSLLWSLCEYLVESSSLALIATHFYELTQMISLYPSKVKHMSLMVNQIDDKLQFSYKASEDKSARKESKVQNYGIKVAEMTGIDKEITNKAKEFVQQIKQYTKIQDAFTSECTRYHELIEKMSSLYTCVKEEPQNAGKYNNFEFSLQYFISLTAKLFRLLMQLKNQYQTTLDSL